MLARSTPMVRKARLMAWMYSIKHPIPCFIRDIFIYVSNPFFSPSFFSSPLLPSFIYLNCKDNGEYHSVEDSLCTQEDWLIQHNSICFMLFFMLFLLCINSILYIRWWRGVRVWTSREWERERERGIEAQRRGREKEVLYTTTSIITLQHLYYIIKSCIYIHDTLVLASHSLHLLDWNSYTPWMDTLVLPFPILYSSLFEETLLSSLFSFPSSLPPSDPSSPLMSSSFSSLLSLLSANEYEKGWEVHTLDKQGWLERTKKERKEHPLLPDLTKPHFNEGMLLNLQMVCKEKKEVMQQE